MKYNLTLEIFLSKNDNKLKKKKKNQDFHKRLCIDSQQKQVVLACFVAAAAAAPSDIVVGYDLDDHEHIQKGEAGTAVTGSYS